MENNESVKLFDYQEKFVSAVIDLIDKSNGEFNFMNLIKSGKSVVLNELERRLTQRSAERNDIEPLDRTFVLEKQKELYALLNSKEL